MLSLLSHASRQGWNNGPNVLERLTSAQRVVLGRGHHHHRHCDDSRWWALQNATIAPVLLMLSHVQRVEYKVQKRPITTIYFLRKAYFERMMMTGLLQSDTWLLLHINIRYVVSFYNTSAAAGNELICKEKWARRAEPVKLWSLSFTSKVYKKGNF